MLLLTAALLIAALGIAACGGGGDDDDDSRGADSSAAAQSQAEDQAEEQASDGEAGPPPDGDEQSEAPVEPAIVFEERELVSTIGPGRDGARLGSVTVAVPAAWVEAEDFPGLFGPEDDPFSVQFNVGSTCGGGCAQRTAGEWAEIAEDVEFSQFRDGENFEVELEEELADGKLLVATSSIGLEFVVVARWLEGRTEYFYCRFSTSDSERYPLAQFEQACLDADIADLPESSST